jgi:spore coat protein U-like protein
MDFSEKGLKSSSDKDFRHFQKVKLQPVQSVLNSTIQITLGEIQTMSMLSSRCSVLTAALLGSTLALSSTLISKPAFAAPAPTPSSIQVSATVAGTCTLSTTPMTFGSYNSSNEATAVSTILVTCTNGLAPEVHLDQGQNPLSGSTLEAPQRSMVSSNFSPMVSSNFPAGTLAYGIYQDQNNTVWGSGGTSQSFLADGTATGLTAYGKIPAGQTAPVGDYSDTVAVTVTY